MRITRFALVLLVVLAACRAPAGTSRAAAESFLDAHYVRIELAQSRELTVDLARSKVDKEIALLSGVAPEPQSAKPRIGYRLVHSREPAADEAMFVYELTIAPSGADPFKKEVMLTTRKVDGDWKISNYSEKDVAS
jgi:hypothetical protein